MLKSHITMSMLLLSIAVGALAMPAMASETTFVCTHTQFNDYWVFNKNPIVRSEGVTIEIKKIYGGPANAPVRTEVVSLTDGKVYRMGGEVGTFGGLKHYEVCKQAQ
jgi:hypothetical protein